MIIKLSKLRKSLYLKINKIRLSFRVMRIDGKLRIYIHEKNKRIISSIKWIVSLIGLFGSLLVLPIYLSFIIALFLFLFTHFLGKFFFFFTSLYFHYIPDFKINNDLWVGMGFGYAELPDRKFHIPLVSLVFSEKNYAKKFFALLRIWNNDSLEDRDNNFVLSIIIDKEDDYYTYIYPNILKERAQEFIREVESRRKKSFPEEMHVRLFGFLFTMKRFVITKRSYFPTFKQRYEDGVPYRLEAWVGTEESANICEDIPGFTKFNLKIKNRHELTRGDIEYDLLRIFGD